jgi:hypothetical protein
VGSGGIELRLLLALALALIASPAYAATQFTDIACETSTTTGTGTLDLAGAKSGGYLGFASGITSGSTVPYTLTTGTGASRKVETGFGVFTDAATDTLTRVASWSSDGSGAELNLTETSTVCVGPIAGLFTLGAGSTIDADKLDGITSADFLTEVEAALAYQPLDSDLTSWAGVTRASGFDTFAATPSMANLGSLLTDDASGWTTFGTTPSSANLDTLVTDDTGSGALVFGTAPDITISATTETNIEGAVDLADLGDNYVLDVADGTGIDGTASGVGSTYTPSLDLTEITEGTGIDLLATTISLDLTELNTVVFGSGTFTTLDFNAGATDPRFTMGSDSVTVTNAATFSLAASTVSTGNIELNHASANTLTASAGVLSIEGVALIPDATNSVDAANINFDYVGTVADGTGIDGTATGEGSTYTPTFDATELTGTTTFGAGAAVVVAADLQSTDDVIVADDIQMTAGGLIDMGGGDVVITFAANDLDFTGVTGDYSFDDSVFVTGVVDASTDVDAGGDLIAGDDLLIVDDINFNGSDVLITYSTNDLAFSGVTGDYSFDDTVGVTGALTATGDVSAGWGDAAPGTGDLVSDDTGAVSLYEAEATGDNFIRIVAPASITSDATCTLENDSNPIPDSCVGDGTDASGSLGDADYGDITVSSSGTVWNVDPVITVDSTADSADGIIWTFEHSDPSPDAADDPFEIVVNAGDDQEAVGQIRLELVDDATTTEDTYWAFTNDLAGTDTQSMLISGQGTIIGTGTTLPGNDGDIRLYSADDSTTGPVLQMHHDDPSADASDIPARWEVFGGDDDEEVGSLYLNLADDATGTEDTDWRFVIRVAGADVERFRIGGASDMAGSGVSVTASQLNLDNNHSLHLAETEANGDNTKAFVSAAANTSDTTCTFENDANFIPDSCVGDGSDASDARLKKILNPANPIQVGALLDQVRIYDFVWTADSEKSEKVRKGDQGFGPMAQELFQVNSDWVEVGGEDPIAQPWTWKPEAIVPYLIVEIQNLRKRVQELEARP